MESNAKAYSTVRLILFLNISLSKRVTFAQVSEGKRLIGSEAPTPLLNFFAEDLPQSWTLALPIEIGFKRAVKLWWFTKEREFVSILRQTTQMQFLPLHLQPPCACFRPIQNQNPRGREGLPTFLRFPFRQYCRLSICWYFGEKTRRLIFSCLKTRKVILCNEDCFLFCHSSFSWSCRSAPQRLISTKSTDVSSFGKWYWQKVWPIFHRNFPTQAQPQRSNLSARTWIFDPSELIMRMNPGRMPQEKVSTSRHNNSQISWLES